MMATTEQRYVSTISVTTKRRKTIPAGQLFFGYSLKKHTLEKLIAQGYITEYNPSSPVQILGSEAKKKTGPANQTPKDAITPKKNTGPEVLTDAQFDEKNDLVEELKRLGVLARTSWRLDTLKRKLVEIKSADKTKPKLAVDKVWDVAPESLAELPLHELLAAYKNTCTKYGLPIEKFDDKELLIQKMSSQYGM